MLHMLVNYSPSAHCWCCSSLLGFMYWKRQLHSTAVKHCYFILDVLIESTAVVTGSAAATLKTVTRLLYHLSSSTAILNFQKLKSQGQYLRYVIVIFVTMFFCIVFTHASSKIWANQSLQHGYKHSLYCLSLTCCAVISTFCFHRTVVPWV